MKKMTKILLAAAGVFAVLGIGFTTAGVVTGASLRTLQEAAVRGEFHGGPFHWLERWSDETEDRVETRMEEVEEDMDDWADRVEREVDGWAGDVENDMDDWADDVEDRIEGSAAGMQGGGVIEADRIRKLEIDMKYGDVHIASHEGKDISVEEHYDGKEGLIQTKVTKDGTLQFTGTSRELKNSELWIYLPEGMTLAEAELDMGAGAMEVEKLIAEELEVKIGIGTFYAESMEAMETSMEVGTGQLEVERLDCGDMEVECGIGTADIRMTGAQEDYSYELSCGMGDLTIGENSYSALGSKEEKIRNPGSKGHIEAACGMGNLTIAFEA